VVQGVQEGVWEVREEQEEEVEQRGMEVRGGREGQEVVRKEREGKREKV
jgi:hypothetical protein